MLPLPGIYDATACVAEADARPAKETTALQLCIYSIRANFAQNAPLGTLAPKGFQTCNKRRCFGLTSFRGDKKEEHVVTRENALRQIAVGDIFHASAPNGASLICLTWKIAASVIYAKTVTTQIEFEFDRKTGIANWEGRNGSVNCVVDSVAPLPTDIHEIMPQLNRRYLFVAFLIPAARS